jgi:quercetin dioxygenase-like cupin family protein
MPSVPDTSIEEILLSCRSASDVTRREAELLAAGARPEEIAAARDALAALGATEVEADAPALRGRLLASVGRVGRYGRFADRLARLFDLPVEKVVKLIAKLDDPKAWQPWLDGVQMIPVVPGPAYEGAAAGFGRLRPGARFPLHDHNGDETTVVLDGGFRNLDDGTEVWRGEELWRPAGTEHEFLVLEGRDCIAAVCAQKGVKFR